MNRHFKAITCSLILMLALSSCTLFAPEEEKKVREALSGSGIAYERFHRSFEGSEQYSYRLTLKDNSVTAEALTASLEAFYPVAKGSSFTITNPHNDYSLKFFGGGEEDIAEARLLAGFIKEKQQEIAELHYVEPQQEAPSGEKLRTVIEFKGELDKEGIVDSIQRSSIFAGGTVLYFNNNKIALIGGPAEDELEAIAESLSRIYGIIENRSPHAQEYDYHVTAITEDREITVTKSISDDAVIDKKTILSVPLPPGWKLRI